MDKEWTDQFEVYPIDTSVIQEMDWALLLGGAALTLLCVATFVYWLYKLLAHLYAANSGKVALGERQFWLRMTIGIILIMALMSGVWLTIIDSFYAELSRMLKGWEM